MNYTTSEGPARTSVVLSLIYGLTIAIGIAVLATLAAQYIGTELMGFDQSPLSSVMVALLVGVALKNTIGVAPALDPGITFASKRVLRAGIILLGIRLSVVDVLEVGSAAIPIVAITVIAAVALVRVLSARLSVSSTLTTLISVGTSICGVSAIIAVGPTINAKEEEISYAVATITLFGLIALIAYPFLAHFVFSANSIYAGYFIGTAIHDTSQVTGAALTYAEIHGSPRTIDVAMVTKLLRNLLMVVIVPLMAISHRKTSKQPALESRISEILRLVPLFAIGFLLATVIRTTGDATVMAYGSAFGLIDLNHWEEFIRTMSEVGVAMLVTALGAVGLKTRFKSMARIGLAPLVSGFLAAVSVAVISMALIFVFKPSF